MMLGWIGWFFIFVGMWLIGRKDIRGFYLNIVAGTAIGIDAIIIGNWSLLVANTLVTCLYIRNIFKWRKPHGKVHQGHCDPGERPAPSDHRVGSGA